MSITAKRFETLTASYSVTRLLGEGGAGNVYAVVDEHGTEFALKALKGGRIPSEKLKRFRNEVAFCKRNVHSAIVSVVDDGFVLEQGLKLPFYVMPRYRGTLRDHVKTLLPHDTVLRVYARLLDGVEAAHLNGVWHRDLKPENVLVGETAEDLVVADFGVAHFEQESLWTAVETAAGDRLANFSYAAPEQKQRGGAVDARADIFALGLILNELFTGVVPHGKAHKTISEAAPQFSYLDPLVDRMMAQNPGARPASVAAVKAELIARGHEFVSQQKLSELRRTVIPASSPEDVPDVKFASLDYQNGCLLITLDQEPVSGWSAAFQNPRENHSSFVGYGPERFSLRGKVLSIGCPADMAEALVRSAQQYATMATRAVRTQRADEAKRKDQAERKELEKRIAAEEERQRVLARLNTLKLG